MARKIKTVTSEIVEKKNTWSWGSTHNFLDDDDFKTMKSE